MSEEEYPVDEFGKTPGRGVVTKTFALVTNFKSRTGRYSAFSTKRLWDGVTPAYERSTQNSTMLTTLIATGDIRLVI